MIELYKVYKDIILQNQDHVIDDYKKIFKKVQQSPAVYKGKVVKFLYQPVFLSKRDYEYLQTIAEQLVLILNKVINKYVKDDEFRSYFGFPQFLEKLILRDPGYGINVPIARFDAFYGLDGNLQFCELNADGSSGMVEVRELQNIIAQSFPIEKLKENYTFEGFELLDSWAEALLDNYKEFSKSDYKPQIAIVDFLHGEPRGEFKEFKKTFESFGCKTIIADLRDLTYRGNKLYYEDFRIDCIYRRAVTWEIVENENKIKDFINAYLDGNVCVVGPLRSQLIHNKLIFAILHDSTKTSFLTEDERRFIERHIPYTTELNIENEDLVGFIINNKDELVLKPTDKYASKGVCIGIDYNKHEWERVIKGQIKEQYIVQQFCNVPKLSMPMIKDENIDFAENNYLLGLFMYNENLQGIYTRTSTTNVIGAEIANYTVPSFIVDKK